MDRFAIKEIKTDNILNIGREIIDVSYILGFALCIIATCIPIFLIFWSLLQASAIGVFCFLILSLIVPIILWSLFFIFYYFVYSFIGLCENTKHIAQALEKFKDCEKE